MEINSCVVVIKQTALAQGGRAAQLAQRGDATAKRLYGADASHKRTCETVLRALQKHRIAPLVVSLNKPIQKVKTALAQADLVITVGGDGTALGASHFVTDGLLLGVNSAPGDSVGHFCSVQRLNFAARLNDVIRDAWLPTELTRLAVSLDDQLLPELALNDVLIAHDCPAATTRYLIQLDGYEEEHRSSGIWISTAAGSTAGIHSAGGRKMSLHSSRMQYLVRELYREVHGGLERSYRLQRGMIESDQTLTIASKMQEGWLYIDGARTAYRFPFGTRAKIRVAERKLRLLR